MRKLQFLTIIAGLFMTTISTHAIVGFGIYGGVEISESSPDTNVVNVGGISIGGIESAGIPMTVTTTEIENAGTFGGHVYLEIPVIPFSVDLSGGFSWASYNAEYNFAGLSDIAGPISIDDVPFASSNVMATLKWHVVDPPIVKPYIAAGIGSQFVTPTATDASLYEGESGGKLITSILELANPTADPDYGKVAENILDVAKDLSFESRMVWNVGAGAMIKFPVIPLAIHIDYRFNFAQENEAMSHLAKNYHTITGGIGLNF